MEIEYSDKALKQLEKIVKGDRSSGQKIVDKIEEYAGNPRGLTDVKRLKGRHNDRLRLRCGNYRILYKIEKNVMKISIIKHRKEAYND